MKRFDRLHRRVQDEVEENARLRSLLRAAKAEQQALVAALEQLRDMAEKHIAVDPLCGIPPEHVVVEVNAALARVAAGGDGAKKPLPKTGGKNDWEKHGA